MTSIEEGLYHQVNNAVMRLGKRGLYAKGSHPIDWAEHPDRPILRGGTRLDGAEDEIQVIQGVFYLHLEADNTFLLRYPTKGQMCEEQPFKTILEVVDYIEANWSGPPEYKYPYERAHRRPTKVVK
jgi:hypothetical protein